MAGGVRRSRPPDLARAERGVRELLLGLGFELEAGELEGTPARVVNAYAKELLAGYDDDLAEVIREGSEPCSGALDPVLLTDIQTATVCPHHLLVAEGRAMVAYEPGARLLGLGTIVRVVEVVSRRLAFQEEIAGLVVRALMEEAGAQGAYCQLELEHACLRDRGSRERAAKTLSAQAAGTLSEPGRLAWLLGVRGGAP
jgi:GTP cyclohydrolase IA